jgi:multiple sugar transport system substrate-binding protein
MDTMLPRGTINTSFLVALLFLLGFSTNAATVHLKLEMAVPPGRDDIVAYHNYLISEFEAQNPGITVELVPRPTDWQAKTPLMIASGMGSDVLELADVAGPSWALAGLLLDLTPYIEQDMTEKEIKDFFPSAWQIGIAYTDTGKIHYGLPPTVNMNLLYYNKEHFDQAGLPYISVLDNQGEWNWDKLVEVAKRLTRRHGDGTTIQWGFGQNGTFNVTGAAPFVYAAGGNFFDWPLQPREFVLDQSPAIEGLNFFYDLIWTHEVHPRPKALGNMVVNATNFGKGAFSIMGLWSSNQQSAELSNLGSWDFGPRPVGPKGRGYMTGVDQIGINAKTQHPEEAWLLVKHITSKSSMEANTSLTGRGPARFSATPVFARLKTNISLGYYMQGAETALPNPSGVIQESSNVIPLINQAIAYSIRDGLMPPEQAIREIADAVRAYFR